MYGFALPSSTNFRQTMQIAMQYHQLATPLAEIFFRETTGRGVWTIAPLAHAVVDASLYKFIVELQFGLSLPKTIFERIDGVGRLESDRRQCRRTARSDVYRA
jgi:hypothetical protein